MADLISLLRFDPEESDDEDEVDPSSDDQKIVEEGAQKQFDSQESYNEVDSPFDDSTIMEEKQFDPEQLDEED